MASLLELEPAGGPFAANSAYSCRIFIIGMKFSFEILDDVLSSERKPVSQVKECLLAEG
jgi:hypothetical protein